MQKSNSDRVLPEDLRAALEAYRNDPSPASWTPLSQLWVRDDVDVLDALQSLKPDFPDPLPVPVEGLIEENSGFYQWPALPDPDDVLEAVVSVLQQRL
jgi:hypothetical protein